LAKSKRLKYNRILLKISGEAISGTKAVFDIEIIKIFAAEIVQVQRMGAEIGLVIGGGNIVRGKELSAAGFERNQSDFMGMLATVINGLLFEKVFHSMGVDAVLQSALQIDTVTEPVILKRTETLLKEKTIIIFTAGTGNPYFTTDTAAALRACQIGADLLLKATKVEGVFDKDPIVFKNAKFFKSISYDEVLKNKLQVMDLTAFAMCRENMIPVAIFNINQRGNIEKIVTGEPIGTLIKE
jgi:uridylate kinase